VFFFDRRVFGLGCLPPHAGTESLSTRRWSERDSNRRSPVGKRALSFETALVDLSDLLPMRGSNDSLARGTETHRRCV
jgi:hypothetical protein